MVLSGHQVTALPPTITEDPLANPSPYSSLDPDRDVPQTLPSNVSFGDHIEAELEIQADVTEELPSVNTATSERQNFPEEHDSIREPSDL